MKTLQLLPSLEVGGVERGVIDLARAMKKRGEQMVVVSSGGSLVAELQKIGVTHYALPVHRKSLASLALVPRLVEIIEKERVQIVHARSRVPAWLGWLAARTAHVPFVTTCHGYYSGHFFSRVMGWGRRVIVISRLIGRHMIDDFGVAPDRIRLIYRGVDLTQFEYKDRSKEALRGTHEKPFRIINIGRLSPIKGTVEFLKSMALVRRQIPSLEVLIVGSEVRGKNKYTDQVRETVKQLGLESCVKLLGSRRDIPELLAASDLLVLSTLVPEAFGRVLIEAGAVGTPALAASAGGVREVIEEGVDGTLINAGDIEGMAEGIFCVFKDPRKAFAMAAHFRKKIEQEFSLDRMIDKTLEVYREAEKERKILVVKLGAAGDLILNVPSFRMIRKRFPEAKISLLVDRKLAPLVSHSPYLDEIIPADRAELSRPGYFFKLAKRIREAGFEMSIDFQNTKWTHLLAFFSLIPKRYGFRRGWAGLLLNRPDPTFKVEDAPVRHQFRLLRKLGITKLDESLELWPDSVSEARVDHWFSEHFGETSLTRVGLVTGSSLQWPTKRWPLEYFSQLAQKLTEARDCQIVLIGSKEDFIDDKFFPGALNLIGKTSLTDLISVIKRLDLLITGDSAPLHVASAVGVKTLALFGPTDPKRHLPPGSGIRSMTKSLPCQPCYSGICKNPTTLECLKKISVEEVYDTAENMLRVPRPVLS